MWTLLFGHHEDRTPTHGLLPCDALHPFALLRAAASGTAAAAPESG
jgi:hypothetical protein